MGELLITLLVLVATAGGFLLGRAVRIRTQPPVTLAELVAETCRHLRQLRIRFQTGCPGDDVRAGQWAELRRLLSVVGLNVRMRIRADRGEPTVPLRRTGPKETKKP